MIKDKIIMFLMLFCFIASPTVASIDIVYPQNNSTTEIYYSTMDNLVYTHVEGNTLTENNFTCVILKNTIDNKVNLIDEPSVIFNSLSGIFYLVVFGFVILLLVYTLKKVLL